MFWFWERIEKWHIDFWYKFSEKTGRDKFIAIYATIYQVLKLIIVVPLWLLSVGWFIQPMLSESGGNFGFAFIANVVLYVWTNWVLFIPNL
ncbi:MAG: hypothetical protein Pg6B_09300 [Candidatus Azobacteroides pseudotrichonymphae]|jgi:fatty acid desaturase|nr:MAG: hypothetical protein Pg6B_09300 [Candidatus Azobacteroides pseudotrichonymphae]